MSKRGFKKAIQKAHTKFLKWAEANNLNFVLSSEMKKQNESSNTMLPSYEEPKILYQELHF